MPLAEHSFNSILSLKPSWCRPVERHNDASPWVDTAGCILKNAYLIYLKHHYDLGCNQHKHYKGYQKLIEFIEPLIIDFT